MRLSVPSIKATCHPQQAETDRTVTGNRMNPSIWNEEMYYRDVCVAEQTKHSDSHSNQDRKSRSALQARQSCCSDDGASVGLDLNASPEGGRDRSAARAPFPAAHASYSHQDWRINLGLQAKRARVENIIKGMSCTGQMEAETIQRLEVTRPSQETKFSPMEGETEGADGSAGASPESSPDVAFGDSCSASRGKCPGWQKVMLMDYFQSKPDRVKLMRDILKYELSRAVSRSVDSVFTSAPLLQTAPDVDGSGGAAAEGRLGLSCCGSAEVQTEALSLVVQKPELGPSWDVLTPPIILSCEPPLSEEADPRRAHKPLQEQHFGRCRSRFDPKWDLVKVKPDVRSGAARGSQTPGEPAFLEGLHRPHVKTEPSCTDKSPSYRANECLTTNHLKKAKLMFFYTRYPSSLVLRMCFRDVQFTRCITSQLIKWFSNFREFYYIQMEKFARSALMEGVVDVRRLAVDRQSELFRALNMHYNKANDFQVPERFLEVAEITLREFYVAISLGKDHDPSWKKAIYKIICRLDSDVPAEFKKYHFG